MKNPTKIQLKVTITLLRTEDPTSCNQIHKIIVHSQLIKTLLKFIKLWFTHN